MESEQSKDPAPEELKPEHMTEEEVLIRRMLAGEALSSDQTKRLQERMKKLIDEREPKHET